MFAWVFKGRTCRGQTGRVGCIGVARTGQILLLAFGVCFNRHGLVADVVVADEVRKVQLGCGAGLDADSRTIQILGRGNAKLFWYHEALAVIVVNADKVELEVDVPAEGPCGVTCEEIDLARRQRGETGFAGCRNEFDSVRVAQYSSSYRTAYCNVKAFPFAIGVGGSKTGQTCGNAAVQLAARFDIVKRGRSSSASRKASYC